MKSLSTENLAASSSCEQNGDGTALENVNLKIIYNKEKFDVSFNLDATVSQLKDHIQTLTGVPSSMQKIVFKGMAKDEKTLRESGFTDGAKVMVVGSKLTDVLSVNLPTKPDSKEEKSSAPTKEPLCRQKMHKKIIDKGVPPDAMPAWKNEKSPLPPEPLYGMCNKSGGKVRLTFKLETDQLWLGTKERTDKISMNSIRAVISEPIEGHEEYHIMALQLGPTEASRYWIYWVPAQYIHSIKETILGK
ncbi:ubiquitin domain-containing protein UBFD1-like isoform X2 [Dinothrombium tinctorium]|uniref:Ubiquitin domain-containing protein UBFD1-like isoform X2 n=1 Tax=Dinothrombium tinctorium TaxID=1965070 RepID=A0A443QWQ5_9ACAR|nr:ubiquitin domain-containing protein UBFD1-like isoform X2 [Dinothrombium tinctorium]